MKQIFAFIKLAAYILGLVGGFGYAMYSKAYVIGCAIVILGIMAFPEFKKAIDELK